MILIKGADYLVDGSSSIASRLGVSSLVIGLTVVAFGTSAPELIVNIISASSGATDLALGNINGSNIANILLILGVAAFITTIPVKSRTVLKEIPFMLLSGLALVIVASDQFLNGASQDVISRTDGMMLLCIFLIFLYYLFLSAKEAPTAKVEKPKYKFPLAVLFTVMGLVGLFVGGKLVVSGATAIAEVIGISESLIGLTVVALGTSLPELVSAVVASVKGKTDLAIGNVVGSSIFNILLVLGATAVISPIVISQRAALDALIALLVMLMFFAALFLNKNGRSKDAKGLDRATGIIFILLYVVYIVYIVIRG